MNKESILSCKGIHKKYDMGQTQLEVLKGIDLEIYKGEAVCIMGSSGAGKTTLLHILGTLDRASQGEVFFRNENVSKKNDEEMAMFRNRTMGFVFQFHHLLKEFTALENVMMPCRIAGISTSEAKALASELLNEVGLSHRASHFPSEMSGGEQQRVAVARALVRNPEILFADEPTGNLDTVNGFKMQEMFFKLKTQRGLTLVTVSHDKGFAERFPRVITMQDGLIRR